MAKNCSTVNGSGGGRNRSTRMPAKAAHECVSTGLEPAVIMVACLMAVAVYGLFAQSDDSPRFALGTIKRNPSGEARIAGRYFRRERQGKGGILIF